jgi:anti-sigma B factor antagonist
MEVQITKHDSVTTARFIGRLDTPAPLEIAKDVETLVEAADGTVVLDCSEMTYISSSGLRIFLTLRKASSAKGGKIIVRNINNDIRQVFIMTGFLNLFVIEN